MTNTRNSYSLNPSWGKIVASFDAGVFEYFELHNEEDFFYFQYIKRDIADEIPSLKKNIYFDIVTPFDYGGFYYTDEEILEKGLKEFENKCKKEGIISAFFRFNPLLEQNNDILGNYIDILKLQDHVFIDLKSEYNNKFSKSKIRDIKRAKKRDYDFVIKDSIDNFYNVYLESMKRINASEYFFFDKDNLSNLLKFGKIFSIVFEKKVVYSIFIIEDEENIYYFLSAGLSNYLKYSFNALLLDLICEYYKNSKKIFFLGGGKGGLYKFKEEFSNCRVPFNIGKKIYNKELYDKLTTKTKQEKNDFFPQYRKKTI